jgi:Tol biopolymer transport system component
VLGTRGKRLLVTKLVKEQPNDSFLLDPDTGKTEPVELPGGVRPLDWSRDGKTFLVVYDKEKKLHLGLLDKGGMVVRELTELKVRFEYLIAARLSPDGHKVLFTDADPERKDAHKWNRSSLPYVLDVVTKKRQPLADFPENAQAIGVAWSPDGKRVAYTWTQLHPELLKKTTVNINELEIPTEAFLIVANADGSNAKTITSGQSYAADKPLYISVDWR